MTFRDVTEEDYRAISRGIAQMQRASSLSGMTRALVRTAIQVAPCDHGGYTETDHHFGRIEFVSSEPEVAEWVRRRADTWNRFMPTHPGYRFRTENPDVRVVRLSDLVPLFSFRQTGIYHELFREVGTNYQLVMHLGFDPGTGLSSGALPNVLGIPLNRSGTDFLDREMQSLSLLQQFALPVLRLKRVQHQFDLLDAATLSPELCRNLMRLGLSQRQAEVAFWMLKGKSNTDIGTILDLSAQTVRQHTIEIYKRLGVAGRLALQRTVLQSITGAD